MPQPEQRARERIDQLLERAGWTVCDAGQVNLSASRGIAIREFPLKTGHGFADYLLQVNRVRRKQATCRTGRPQKPAQGFERSGT